MNEPRVLVVEDEPGFVDALELALPKEGFSLSVARDGREALVMFDAVQPDLVLLDLMLPRVSGIDVCREIRAKSKVPIIMVTAKSSEVDVVVGLELGADDYITKPYRMREMVARMRAVLRRNEELAPVETTRRPSLRAGNVLVDIERHEATINNEVVPLPLKEFDLLALLLENVGRVLERDTLIDRVWGDDYVGDTKTLDVHIKRLRTKIEDDPSHPAHIVTIRGLGYKFVKPRP